MTSQPDIWKALAEPFPDDAVKQRPGRGNMTFSYVDARAVMQRLDDVLTPAGWDFTSAVIPGTDIVKGTLTIASMTREDYGYPNSDHDEEPIKAASSDALKRCAVMFGIGRHLYDDNKSSRAPSSGTGRAFPPARPAAAPRTSTAMPEDVPEFAPNEWDGPTTAAAPRGNGWSFKELADAAERKGIAKTDIYRTADKLFGKDTKVTQLEPGQREQIAHEMGLVA